MKKSTIEQQTNQGLAHYLEGLSRDCITVKNMRDFDHTTPLGRSVRRHISADYSIFLDNGPLPMNFEEENAQYAEWVKQDPQLEFRLIELSAQVDATKGRAVVFQKLDLKGWVESSDVVLKTIVSQSWRLESDGVWKCYEVRGMRNGDMNPGNFGG